MRMARKAHEDLMACPVTGYNDMALQGGSLGGAAPRHPGRTAHQHCQATQREPRSGKRHYSDG